MSARHLWPLACVVTLMALSRAAGAKRQPIGIVKGPYLTSLSDRGVEIRCELEGAAPIAVELSRDGDDGGAPLRFEDRANVSMHVVRATELAPGATYAYAVRLAGRTVGSGRFSTAPRSDSGAPTKFLVYGDDRSDPTAHAAVVRALTAAPSDFLVNTGDMIEDGGRPEDWQSFFDIEAQLLRNRALYVAIGNHELYDDAAGTNFARYFGFADAAGSPRPFGTVRWSNIRFFFLNAMHDWKSADDRQWLERELVGADTEAGLVWRIAVVHQGPWSSGPHGASTVLVQAKVPELLAAHGVDLLFSGHDHIYERGQGTGLKYVISGGGGAPLYRASKIATTRRSESTYHFVEVTTGGDTLHVLARRIDGSVLDECGFRKGGGWDCDAAPPRALPVPSSATGTAAPSSAQCGCSVPGSSVAASPGAILWLGIAMLGVRRRNASG
jgi:hypothetical protein